MKKYFLLYGSIFSFLFQCHYSLAQKDTERKLVAGVTGESQRTLLSLPDTSFHKLISTCVITFKIKDTVKNEVVYKQVFKPADRLQLLTLPSTLLNDRQKFFYEIFWVPDSQLKDRPEPANLNALEISASKVLNKIIQKKIDGGQSRDDLFANGAVYSEEYHSINCTINSTPQGASVYLIPKYDWDFYLQMPANFSEANLNRSVLSKLEKYKIPQGTKLENYGLPEITYAIILEHQGKYRYIASFTPSGKNALNNIIDKDFSK